MRTRPSFIIIGICVLLLASAVFIFIAALEESQEPADIGALPTQPVPSLPTEAEVFRLHEKALDFTRLPGGDKTMEAYYGNRAFPGGPPVIPHPLVSKQGIGGQACLQCHANGGFVAQFQAYAPVTPHPEWLNCRQCHMAVNTTSLFRETDFVSRKPPELGQSAMPGSPPVIPHSLFMRSNCLACHAGPSAPEAIRVTHPERVNCRQCHMVRQTDEIFVENEFNRMDISVDGLPQDRAGWNSGAGTRPVNDSTVFIRSNSDKN